MSQKEIHRLERMSVYENQLAEKGFQKVAGLDEVGRGPLAGPVVAAACILPKGAIFENLNDSKKLTPDERESLYHQLVNEPNLAYGIGVVEIEVIDQINILQASFLAMRQALTVLKVKPDYLLIDGNQLPYFEIPAECVIHGDSLSISIAAASIIAKVTRDRMMTELDAKWPGYGFKNHKGYATDEHMDAIRKFGPCPIHRKSFDPIKTMFFSDTHLDLFESLPSNGKTLH